MSIIWRTPSFCTVTTDAERPTVAQGAYLGMFCFVTSVSKFYYCLTVTPSVTWKAI